MEQITRAFGFNHMTTPEEEVGPDEQIYLKRNGVMIPLGTFNEAKKRAKNALVVGINGENYGKFGTPAIDDNLFVGRHNYSQVLSSAVRGSQVNRFGASNIMSFLGKKNNVDNYVFRNGARVRKSKRANKRMHKKQRTNRRNAGSTPVGTTS